MYAIRSYYELAGEISRHGHGLLAIFGYPDLAAQPLQNELGHLLIDQVILDQQYLSALKTRGTDNGLRQGRGGFLPRFS